MQFTKRVYLDAAAAAPVSEKAKKAFLKALPYFGNPDSVHVEGEEAQALLEEARTTIARLAGVKAGSVFFTKGATDANNVAIFGVIEQKRKEGVRYEDMQVLFQDGAHASIQGPMKHIEALGVHVDTISVSGGELNLEELKNKLTKNTVLVSVERATSEVGMIIHTRDAKRVLEEVGSTAELHVDASQAPLIDLIERTHLGADILTLDAQKVGGVRGIGALILGPRTTLAPRIFGGGQEEGLSPGTPSPALAFSFATALSECEVHRKEFVVYATQIRALLKKHLTQEVSQCVVNEGKEQAPHILNVSVLGRDTDYLRTLLNHKGYAVSTKSACENDGAGSRGVFALTKDERKAETTIRISWSTRVKESDIRNFIRAFSQSVSFIDQHRL